MNGKDDEWINGRNDEWIERWEYGLVICIDGSNNKQ